MAEMLHRRRFTVDEYRRMGESGILADDERLELIAGHIVVREPIGARRAHPEPRAVCEGRLRAAARRDAAAPARRFLLRGDGYERAARAPGADSAVRPGRGAGDLDLRSRQSTARRPPRPGGPPLPRHSYARPG